MDVRSARDGVLPILKDHGAGAFRKDEASAIGMEGATNRVGRVFIARGKYL